VVDLGLPPGRGVHVQLVAFVARELVVCMLAEEGQGLFVSVEQGVVQSGPGQIVQLIVHVQQVADGASGRVVR
jgi:hypothetical protein